MGDSYCKADGHIVTDEKTEYADRGWHVAPEDFPEDLGRDFAFYLNTYSHNVNLLRYLFGQTPSVEYVSFEQSYGRIAVLDFGTFRASLETGRSSCRGWDEHTEIFFADGRLTIYTPPALLKNVPAEIELYAAGKMQEVRRPLCDWTWAFRRQAQAFVSCVLEGRDTLSPGADAIEDVDLVEEMWRLQMRSRNARLAA
jgi:predicted dehydrogenase